MSPEGNVEMKFVRHGLFGVEIVHFSQFFLCMNLFKVSADFN